MLIDSHCHVPHKKYNQTVSEIVQDSKKSGVSTLITIGTSIKENDLVIETANNFDEIYCTVAVYPHEERDISISDLEKSLRDDLTKSNKIVAIGECGVDISNWQNGRSIEEQLALFEMQVKLAVEYNLPITIHNRNGDEDILKMLQNYVPKGLRGVIHCFDSDWNYAEKILDLGFYISFTNMITYPHKEKLLEVVKNVPNNRFLVETDSPYLPPQEHRGEVNYPKYVKMVASKVSEIKQISQQEIEKYSYENTCTLFNI